MENSKKKLYLYEALELRGEYDGRIKTLKDCLPETRQNRDRFSFSRSDDSVCRNSPDFDIASARDELKKIEYKRRKLNNAIQKANFDHQIDFKGEMLNLSESLEMRKVLNLQIGELHEQVVNSAYQRVIYKEGRDIVEENEISYTESMKKLNEARLDFRDLNRKLRLSSFQKMIDFQDE